MKILQVSHGLPPRESAGVELYTFYLSQALAQLNHDVSIFCREEAPEKEEFASSEEDWRGLRVNRVVNNLTCISDPRIFYDNHFFDHAFLNTLKKEKPDLVHFQHFIALSAHLLRMAKEAGSSVVLTLHDYFILCHRVQLLKKNDQLCDGPLYGLECASCIDSVSPPQDLRTRLFLSLKDILPFPFIKWTKRFFIPPKYLGNRGYEVFHRYRFMYEILKIPEIILTPSRFVRNYFLKYYPIIEPKIFALPLGVFPEGSESPFQRKPQPLDGKVRFCYFGNILPSKGLHVLLEAFKGLPEGKATLTIYGSRNIWTETYYDQVRQQAHGFPVDFRPSFGREHLSEALSDQDIVVLPSIWPETFSLMIREAHSLGLPVIASNIGAIPEAIQEEINGFLFDPGNVKGLKRCMLRFIEEPHLLQRMAAQMPRIRTMAEHAEEIASIYERILEKKEEEV
jgi:glycosyltransferase involved in cell wall biosynthesis